MKAELLTTRLLVALADRWQALGAPITNQLQPGLTEAEMESIVAPEGLRLSTEAQVWWGWHNGVSKEALKDPIARAVGGNMFDYLPLTEALGLYRYQRDLAVRAAAAMDVEPYATATFWWEPQWFPISGTVGGGGIALDLAVEDGQPSPVHFVDWEDTAFRRPAAGSLGQAVSWWIEAIDTGYWTFDTAEGWFSPYEVGPGGQLT